MLSSITQYVRMLDGRDRGQVIEVNREIALDLIERKEAIEVDASAKDALKPWDEARLAEFCQQREVAAEHGIQLPSNVPIVAVTEVKVHTEAGDVEIPRAAVEVSVPRAKSKKR